MTMLRHGYWGVLMATPDPVIEGRKKIEGGQRLPSWTPTSRPFFCRNCGLRVIGNSVPRGWYILTRSPGDGQRAHRLGLFCSANCLTNCSPRLIGIESDLGDTWDTAPSPYRG